MKQISPRLANVVTTPAVNTAATTKIPAEWDTIAKWVPRRKKRRRRGP